MEKREISRQAGAELPRESAHEARESKQILAGLQAALAKRQPSETPGADATPQSQTSQIDAAAPDDSPSKPPPEGLSALISCALAIEAEEARAAGALGYMARAMTLASLPHSRAEGTEFARKNGPFTLSIVSRASVGLPYGTVPRLLLAWLTTEAVRTRAPVLVLGDSLSGFMGQLRMMPTGGRWGSIKRLKEQTRRLFSASIAATYEDSRGVAEIGHRVAEQYQLWWDPKDPSQGSLWQSTVTLSNPFFREIINRPVPIDMRALTALKRSPMTLDIYVWLTYRMSYLEKPTTIGWEGLQGQFGAGYPETARGLRAFRAHFLPALKKVLVVYSDAKVAQTETGIRLSPSRPHVAKLPE